MQKVAVLVMLVVGVVARADAADTLNCRLVGSCILEGVRRGMALSGDFAYVAGGYGSLWILDVSDPTAPCLAGRFDTTDMSRSVAVFWNYAYMAAYGSFTGLWIIDVSDPQEPRAAGQYSSPCDVFDIVLSVDFDYAYMPAWDYGLRILDMTDPQEPYEAGHWDGLGKTRGVALSGNLAYVADMDSGLQIVDVSNPQAPHQVGRCSFGYTQTQSVAVSGDFAYVATGDRIGKLRVIDVSNPQEPYEVGYVYTGFGTAVALSGNFAYVASEDGFLYVIDVSDPRNPHVAGWYEGMNNSSVAVRGNLAYTADLKIIEFLGEGVEETPNADMRAAKHLPTVVRGMLCLPEATSRKPQGASLHDISGRKVLDLRPGANDVHDLAPGVYFVRGSRTHAVQKVILAR